MSSTGSNEDSADASSPFIRLIRTSTARAPVSAKGMRTEVSGGVMYWAKGMSSQLTTAKSSGMRRPVAAAAL